MKVPSFGEALSQLCDEYVQAARGEIIGFGPESFENGFASDGFVPVFTQELQYLRFARAERNRFSVFIMQFRLRRVEPKAAQRKQ